MLRLKLKGSNKSKRRLESLLKLRRENWRKLNALRRNKKLLRKKLKLNDRRKPSELDSNNLTK